MPGYFRKREGRLVLSDARNQVRLPPYARLDVRADRGFRYAGLRLTAFAEALNVLNRTNRGPIDGSVDAVTRDVTGFRGTLLPRRLSAGVLVEF